MTSDSQKIEIAKKFAKLHETPFAVWTPDKEYLSDDERYLAVYENLIIGVYGDCCGLNAEYDEEGNLINEATEFEVEVDRFESKGGGEMFSFEITSESTGISKFIEDHGRHGDW
ncbi:MAG: hypothetical protein EPN17_07885 [Methylobacter sp.]|nr:MAG: hypothetical protein EPN17_07885 [Methylobacter sp.]